MNLFQVSSSTDSLTFLSALIGAVIKFIIGAMKLLESWQDDLKEIFPKCQFWSKILPFRSVSFIELDQVRMDLFHFICLQSLYRAGEKGMNYLSKQVGFLSFPSSSLDPVDDVLCVTLCSSLRDLLRYSSRLSLFFTWKLFSEYCFFLILNPFRSHLFIFVF